MACRRGAKKEVDGEEVAGVAEEAFKTGALDVCRPEEDVNGGFSIHGHTITNFQPREKKTGSGFDRIRT